MSLKQLTSANFKSVVLDSTIPVVVDFWAEWCGPCRTLAPVIEELAKEFDGRLSFGKLNVDENRSVAGQYGVQSIPTLLVFKNGVVTQQIIGSRPKGDIKRLLEPQV